MAESAIPQSVREFIAEHVDSVVQLEILLLLQRNRGREFTVSQVAIELRIEPSWTDPRMQDLSAKGFLMSTASPELKYRYAPKSPDIEQTIDQLASAYASHRVTITTLIFTKPPDALKSFADAFRIRKDRTNG